jgi:hypothetical protein
MFNLVFKPFTQVEKQFHPRNIMTPHLKHMGCYFPVSHMRHEDNAALLPLYCLDKIFPSLMSDVNRIVLEKEKPVQKNISEIVKLLPRAPDMIQEMF